MNGTGMYLQARIRERSCCERHRAVVMCPRTGFYVAIDPGCVKCLAKGAVGAITPSGVYCPEMQ